MVCSDYQHLAIKFQSINQFLSTISKKVLRPTTSHLFYSKPYSLNLHNYMTELMQVTNACMASTCA